MITFFRRSVLGIGCLLAGITVMTQAVSAGPQLRTPDGAQVDAANLPYFQDRPNVIGFLEKIVASKREGAMALAVSPPFCPSYSWTAWGGDDPVGRASQKCQAKLDSLLDVADWPVAARLACKCRLAIRNMTVLDPAVLQSPDRYTPVKLFTKQADGKTLKRDGILKYEKTELVKQDFALFNIGRTKICSGQLEFKIGALGKFSGTCFGKRPIRDGGVMVGCASGVFCTRHIVGNMKMGSGALVGFASGLSAAEIAEKYPDLPDTFAIEAPPEQEEEVSD